MSYAIPIKVYEKFEEKLGKETASVIVETLEASINKAIVETQQQQKIAISEELKKELASKYDIELVRKDMDVLRKDMDILRKEIDLVRKDIKIMTIILLAVIILLNQNSLEFLARLLGLLR